MTQSAGISVDICAQGYYIYLPYNYMSENKPTEHETTGVYEINTNNHCTCENNFSWIQQDLNQRPSAKRL